MAEAEGPDGRNSIRRAKRARTSAIALHKPLARWRRDQAQACDSPSRFRHCSCQGLTLARLYRNNTEVFHLFKLWLSLTARLIASPSGFFSSFVRRELFKLQFNFSLSAPSHLSPAIHILSWTYRDHVRILWPRCSI